ncbi:hypothetical protein [Chitiniphilus shinanonensis]|uniref:hypothetical protein n=1 Tax=Chitiniphilus shinanonensis TaxID=553088 RepID=UPI0012FAC3CD|nr:hypothetical protein [Chitiniphilus shinanonensis]
MLVYIGSTELRRKIFGCSVLLGLVLLSRVLPIIPAAVVGLLLIWSCVLHVKRLFRVLEFPKLRSHVRRIRRIRKAFQVGATAKFLYGLTSLLCLVFVAATIFFSGSNFAINLVFYPMTMVFFSAVVVDSWQRLSYLYQYEWFVSIAKWARWGVGAAAAFISFAASKQITHSLVHVDPKFFPDFSNVLSVALYPVILLSVVALLLGFLALFQMIFLLFLLVFQVVVRSVAGSVPGAVNASFASLFWRLVIGKKKKTDIVDDFWGAVYIFSRPIGTFAISVLIFQLLGLTPVVYSSIPNVHLNSALVLLEFRVGHSCKGISSNTPLAYLDRGNVLVQEGRGSSIKYVVKACVYN